MDAQCPEWSLSVACALQVVPLVADVLEEYPRLVSPIRDAVMGDNNLVGYEGLLVYLGIMEPWETRTEAEASEAPV